MWIRKTGRSAYIPSSIMPISDETITTPSSDASARSICLEG